ncbi:MAG TPA: hypothetical protein VGR49_01275 [Actinomycetota bacterium]|jgi:hypothetical protein|nr:hypothetical protein [Actinomycetota bacterium]
MGPRRTGGKTAAAAILASLAIAALAQGGAFAHEERPVGDLELEVGWLEEPALAGFKNGVQVIASRSGEPVEGGRLQVVLIFGGKNGDTRSEPLSVQPVPERPGQYFAAVIPTRPGQYTFHLTGRLGGKRIDEIFTSGPRSFDDVRNPTEAEFPTRDPTPAELADRLDRLDARIEQALAELRTSHAHSGPDALTLILAGAGAALGALALAITLLRRTARGT